MKWIRELNKMKNISSIRLRIFKEVRINYNKALMNKYRKIKITFRSNNFKAIFNKILMNK